MTEKGESLATIPGQKNVRRLKAVLREALLLLKPL